MALNSLPLFHRVSGQRVVVLGDGDAADAKRRLVERAGGICCGEPEAHHARLAFVAIDDPRAAEAAAIRLRCKGLLVNVARGSVVDEAALIACLQNGSLGGAALDVFEDEPHVPEALLALDQVVLTPHMASGTHETRQAMADLTLANLRAGLAGERLPARAP